MLSELALYLEHLLVIKLSKNLYHFVLGRATASPPIFTEKESTLSTRIVPGAVTFQDRDSMTKMSAVSPVGTLAYVIEEEALLVRVNAGWQYIAVSIVSVITGQECGSLTEEERQ